MKKITIISVVLFVISFSAIADDAMGLNFYRGSDGSITRASAKNAKSMRNHATANGHIDLWLTLNYSYNLFPDHMTAEELELQRAEVEAGFSEVLDRLVARGYVKHPKAGPFVRGPGCAVRATKIGLNKLLKDTRIIQVVAMNYGGSE